MYDSKKFPEIDSTHFFKICDLMENSTLFKDWEQDDRIDRLGIKRQAMFELLFIRCTRNDITSGLKSALCRSELLEALVRLAVNIYFPKTANENPVKAV